MQRILGWIAGVVAVGVVFVVANALLVGGQKLWHSEDQAKLDRLTTGLERERLELRSLEVEMTALAAGIDGQVAELSSLRAGIEITERRYPEGAPPTVYGEHSRSLSRFNSMVERHNSDVERYQSLYTSNSLRVDKYNGEVNEANALSGAIGGTWYVVPVPRGGGRALAR